MVFRTFSNAAYSEALPRMMIELVGSSGMMSKVPAPSFAPSS